MRPGAIHRLTAHVVRATHLAIRARATIGCVAASVGDLSTLGLGVPAAARRARLADVGRAATTAGLALRAAVPTVDLFTAPVVDAPAFGAEVGAGRGLATVAFVAGFVVAAVPAGQLLAATVAHRSAGASQIGTGTRSADTADIRCSPTPAGLGRLTVPTVERIPAPIVDATALGSSVFARPRGTALVLVTDLFTVDFTWAHAALDRAAAPIIRGAAFEVLLLARQRDAGLAGARDADLTWRALPTIDTSPRAGINGHGAFPSEELAYVGKWFDLAEVVDADGADRAISAVESLALTVGNDAALDVRGVASDSVLVVAGVRHDVAHHPAAAVAAIQRPSAPVWHLAAPRLQAVDGLALLALPSATHEAALAGPAVHWVATGVLDNSALRVHLCTNVIPRHTGRRSLVTHGVSGATPAEHHTAAPVLHRSALGPSVLAGLRYAPARGIAAQLSVGARSNAHGGPVGAQSKRRSSGSRPVVSSAARIVARPGPTGLRRLRPVVRAFVRAPASNGGEPRR